MTHDYSIAVETATRFRCLNCLIYILPLCNDILYIFISLWGAQIHLNTGPIAGPLSVENLHARYSCLIQVKDVLPDPNTSAAQPCTYIGC